MAPKKRQYSMAIRADKSLVLRARICDAALEAYRERPIEDFTLQNVAQRARTTVQTILRTFGSKENLVMAALTAFVEAGAPLKRTAPGDVPAAIDAFFDIYESIGDVVIARLADERRLPALKRSLDEGRAGHSGAVAQIFAPYLRRNEALHEMLCVITDAYVWKLLRRDRGLDRAAAQSIVTALATAAIKEHAHGKDALAKLVGRRKPTAQPRNSAGTRRARQ